MKKKKLKIVSTIQPNNAKLARQALHKVYVELKRFEDKFEYEQGVCLTKDMHIIKHLIRNEIDHLLEIELMNEE